MYALIHLGFSNAAQTDGDDEFNEDFDAFSKEIRTSLIYMACEAVVYSALVLLVERCVHRYLTLAWRVIFDRNSIYLWMMNCFCDTDGLIFAQPCYRHLPAELVLLQ